MRVATSYPGSSARSSSERASHATSCTLDGAVESAVRLGVADAVADVVETGTTLRRQGLEIFGPVILRVHGRAHRRRRARPTGIDDAAAAPAGRAWWPAATC